jgi:hypothetical protein
MTGSGGEKSGEIRVEPLVSGRFAAMRLRDILDGDGKEAP